MTTRLIVNADDFGLTSGVNRAILQLHQAGVLTSATLMARAAATEEAIEIAKATPSLDTGCHVVLVDGEPLLSAAHQIPAICEADGTRLLPTLGLFLFTIYLQNYWTSKVEQQIEIEAHAQIQSLQFRGLQLTHIDTHKHTHMFPRVLRPVLRAARSCGIHAVRNPFEPDWSVRATRSAPPMRSLQVRVLRLLQSSFLRIVAEEGFTTTAGSLGIVATGTLDRNTVASLAAAMPVSGIYELVTHPGYNDPDLARANTRLLTSRDIEREALLELRNIPDVELSSFAALS